MTAELPETFASSALFDRCEQEIARFRRRDTYDDRFCFEIFRRAIALSDDECWARLQQIYHSQLLSWCRRAGSSPRDELEALVNDAWTKFWRSFGPSKLAQANGTPAIQRYLRMCVQSAVVDVTRERGPALSLDQRTEDERDEGHSLGDQVVDPAPLPEDLMADEAAKAELWAEVAPSLLDERDRLLVYLRFELGLSSAQIQARRPDQFPTANDVYRVQRNLLDRLRRSPAMRRWYDADRV